MRQRTPGVIFQRLEIAGAERTRFFLVAVGKTTRDTPNMAAPVRCAPVACASAAA